MTEYNIRTTMEEADDIASGKKDFIFRGVRQPYGVGDYITFTAFDGVQRKRHVIDNMRFRITYVNRKEPVAKGFKVLGFRKVTP